MKLNYILLFFFILQLSQGKKSQKVVNAITVTTTENEEDLTDLPSLVPDELEKEDDVGDNPKDTTILNKMTLNEFASEGSTLEDDQLREIDTSVPDVLLEEELPTEYITQEDGNSPSNPDLGVIVKVYPRYYMRGRGANIDNEEVTQDAPDMIQSDGVITSSPDQSFVKGTPLLYVKRVGESPGEETYIPIQDLVKGDLNSNPEGMQEDGNPTTSSGLEPNETYYIRQDGTNPGEYIYVPIQVLGGAQGINMGTYAIQEDGNSNLGAAILNKTDILYGPGPIPVREWDVNLDDGGVGGGSGGGGGGGGGGGPPLVPIPYYMSYMRRNNSEGAVVFDDAEDIPRPVPYEPVYMEGQVFKGQEDNIPLNDTELITLYDKEGEIVPIRMPTKYVDGALRATGGGIKEEENPGDIRLFVKQNEYPELLPTMRVPANSFPNLAVTESGNVKGTNVNPKAPPPVKLSAMAARPATNTEPVVKSSAVKPIPKSTTVTKASPKKTEIDVKVSKKIIASDKTASKTKSDTGKSTDKANSPEKPVTVTKSIPVKAPATPKSSNKELNNVKAPTKEPVNPVKKSAAKPGAVVKQTTTVKTSVNVNKIDKTTTTNTVKPPLVKQPTTVKPPINTNKAVKNAPTTKAPVEKSVTTSTTRPPTKAPAVKSVSTTTVRPTTKAPAVKSVTTTTARPTTKAPAVKSVTTSTTRPTTKASAVKSVTTTTRPTTKPSIVKSAVTKTPPIQTNITT